MPERSAHLSQTRHDPDPHSPRLDRASWAAWISQFGGIGINGHLAFNESQDELTPEEFAALHTRVLAISRETRTANAIGDLSGAIDAMPKKAVTIGMAEILGRDRRFVSAFSAIGTARWCVRRPTAR